MKTWLQITWPVALLLLYAAVFYREPADRRDADAVAECDQSAALEIRVLERCLQFQPDDVELLLALGTAYDSGSRLADAERVFRRALDVDPRDGDVHLHLGQVLLQIGDAKAARAEGNRALALLPGNPVAIRLIERAALDGVIK